MRARVCLILRLLEGAYIASATATSPAATGRTLSHLLSVACDPRDLRAGALTAEHRSTRVSQPPRARPHLVNLAAS
eukprot:jgi/Tetstr1/443064/TSEL_031122.t1